MSMQFLVIDDHPLIRQGVSTVLTSRFHGANVVDVGSGQEAVSALAAHRFDAAITDLSMPVAKELDGISLIKAIKTACPALRIVVYTSTLSAAVTSAVLRLDVAAVVDKGAALGELVIAVQMALLGRRYISENLRHLLLEDGAVPSSGRRPRLSPRQLDVVRLLGRGLTNMEVAHYLDRSPKTISRLKRQAMEKLLVHSDMELYSIVKELGLAR
jgi:two-component system capsular synthesis response regulator RcsB